MIYVKPVSVFFFFFGYDMTGLEVLVNNYVFIAISYHHLRNI